MTSVSKLDRREFVKLGALAGGGLLLGVRLPVRRPGQRDVAAVPLQPNAFVQVAPDGQVTIWLGRADMGQGVRTALPMLVAEELDADWSAVKIVQADADPRKYGRMMTVGSSSVRGNGWMSLRQAGATARAMLVTAAAAKWGVNASQLRTEKGRILHDASKRSMGYGEVADAAAALPVPSRPRLKDPKDFTLVGTRVPLVDSLERVTGKAAYGIDARVPGMLFATVVHPPVFGDSVGSFDATKAKAVAGVKDVVQISQGVAVVANSTWAAFKGAKALEITWTHGGFDLGSDDIARLFEKLAGQSGASAKQQGDAAAALSRAAKRVSATYDAPYLAHATMEPMNCTVDLHADRCEVWAPTQNPQGVQSTTARLTGLPIDKVTVHVQYLGCGWGRRSRTDFVEDAVETALKVRVPVQVLWTREEDMQHDQYRPSSHVHFEGGVDASGKVVAFQAKVVAQPISGGRGRGGVDGPAVAAIANSLYDLPNVAIDYVRPDLEMPVGYWRSVGPSQNGFFYESFIDELAHAAGRDPVEFRLELLASDPRGRNVVQVAAQRSGWGTAPPQGRARGIAFVEDTGTRVAEIAEVSLQNNAVTVHRVWCVADLGHVVHPGVVEAQLQGAIIGGLSAALYGEITLEKGRVVQDNFDDYRMVRMRQAPQIDVFLVSSTEDPGGAGEPGLPPIAAAVGNALFALTGTRIRRLPMKPATLSAIQSRSK